MKQPTLANTKSMFWQTRNLIKIRLIKTRSMKTRLAKTGQESLNRISADMAKKEYLVFVDPVLRRLRHRFKDGFKQAFRPSSRTDGVSAPVTTKEPTSRERLRLGPPTYSLRAGEADAESRLVDEIFVRPTPAIDQANGGDEHGEPVSSGFPPAVDSNIDLKDDLTTAPLIGPVAAAGESTASTETTRLGSNNGPLLHTMVEAVPDLPADEAGPADFLSEDLQDIFKATDYSNPRTKALVRSREHVDVYELAKELREYARSIGAVRLDP